MYFMSLRIMPFSTSSMISFLKMAFQLVLVLLTCHPLIFRGRLERLSTFRASCVLPYFAHPLSTSVSVMAGKSRYRSTVVPIPWFTSSMSM